jgi:hypothetical protein
MPEIQVGIATLSPVPTGDTATPQAVQPKPGQLDYKDVLIGKDGVVHGLRRGTLADCFATGEGLNFWDANFNIIPPQPNGLQRYGGYCKITPTSEGSRRGYTLCIGVRARVGVASVMADLVCWTMWVDPSGYVRTTTGVPLAGAKVVLYRSGVRTGPFAPVENGSARMAPQNRKNPDRTDASGHFGWDVVSGFYKVRASLAGCTSPKSRRVKYVETRVLEVPPPVLDLDLRLRCPAAPKAKRKPAITGQLRVGKTVTCVRGPWTGTAARFRYLWLRDGGPITGARKATYRLTARDKGRRVGCLIHATSRFGNVVVRSKAAKVR